MQVPISDSSWKIMTVHELTSPCGHHWLEWSEGWSLWTGHALCQSPLSPLGLHCPHGPVRLYL